MSALTYAGLVKIPPRYLFSVTSMLIAFLAAGMASQCVAFLQRADILDLWSATLWDTSWLLAGNSLAGRVLHTLIGYDERPSILQAVAYIVTLATILVAMRVFAPAKPQPKPAMRLRPQIQGLRPDGAVYPVSWRKRPRATIKAATSSRNGNLSDNPIFARTKNNPSGPQVRFYPRFVPFCDGPRVCVPPGNWKACGSNLRKASTSMKAPSILI